MPEKIGKITRETLKSVGIDPRKSVLTQLTPSDGLDIIEFLRLPVARLTQDAEYAGYDSEVEMLKFHIIVSPGNHRNNHP